MGTVRLDYDDGSSCEIRLSFTGTGVGGFAYDCGERGPGRREFPPDDGVVVRSGDSVGGRAQQLLLHFGADADQPGGRGR